MSLMSRLSFAVALAAGAVMMCAGLVPTAGAAAASPSAGSAAARIHWGRAEQVPGLAALNKGFNASVNGVSCWGAGGCAAGGDYTDAHGRSQAFVALEVRGRWARAEQVPGTAALNLGGKAQVSSVSCARTTVCAAVGTYADKAGKTQWFTVTERGRRWGKAALVPVPALDQAGITTVWCRPGMCAAGGQFVDSTATTQAWVMTQTGGRWHAALEVPGIATLNVQTGNANVNAISCSSPGNCAAGGTYTFNPAPGLVQRFQDSAFVVAEAKGKWGEAEEVPGVAALNLDAVAYVSLMSCPSSGNCTAAGYVYHAPPEACSFPCYITFTTNEHDGVWGSAGQPGLNDNGALTCVSAGDCVLGGDSYVPGSSDVFRVGMASESNRRWGATVSLNGATSDSSVSCSSAGYCATGGQNDKASAFVASESHGIWGKAVTPAGIPARYNAGYQTGAIVNAISCPPKVALCLAGGSYEGPKGGLRAFLVGQVR
jgi:hypothetical protein